MKYQLECYPKGARKLCHCKGGEVVRPVFNDGTPPDLDYWLVASGTNSITQYRDLINMRNGCVKEFHTSSRVLRFDNATLYPYGIDEDC